MGFKNWLTQTETIEVINYGTIDVPMFTIKTMRKCGPQSGMVCTKETSEMFYSALKRIKILIKKQFNIMGDFDISLTNVSDYKKVSLYEYTNSSS